LQEDQFYHRWI